MFDSTFVTRLSTYLEAQCVDGQTVTRTQVCEALGLDKIYESTISAIVKRGDVPGYEIRKGLHGGVGRAGEKPAKKERDPNAPKNVKAPELPEGFAGRLSDTLATLCADNKCVTRDQIAKAMGEPGSKTEFMISVALKYNLVTGYGSKKGRHGGIHSVALPALSADGASDEPVVEAEPVVEPVPEPVVEAAPEPQPEAEAQSEEAPAKPKRAKRSRKAKSEQATA